jgi:Transposase DDE domain group 1
MHATSFLPGLSPVEGKPLTATFDAGRLSSDGDVIVLREIALRLGLAKAITAPLLDKRDPSRVQHAYADMALARMVMMAAGYEDCDDIDTLRADPAFKIALGRKPDSGADLMSQPTLSRLENLADWRTLVRIGLNLIDLFCTSYARPPTEIVLDIDDTDDPVHGQQELALFNTHVGDRCFQPIHIFEATSGKPILSLLRPGQRPSGAEAARILRHVIGRIRKHWPAVRILVRGMPEACFQHDSHYLSPETLDFLRQAGCDYILALAINAKLKEIAAPWLLQCDIRRSPSQRKVRRFHQFQYAAESWSRPQKVIARIEATDLGTDARFVGPRQK